LRNSMMSCPCHFPMMAVLAFFEQDENAKTAQQPSNTTISREEN